MTTPGIRSSRAGASAALGDLCGNEAASHASQEHSPRWLRWVTRVSLAIGIAALIATIWLVGPNLLVAQIENIGWFFLALVALELATSICDATAVYFIADGPGRPSWRACVVAQVAARGI